MRDGTSMVYERELVQVWYTRELVQVWFPGRGGFEVCVLIHMFSLTLGDSIQPACPLAPFFWHRAGKTPSEDFSAHMHTQCIRTRLRSQTLFLRD